MSFTRRSVTSLLALGLSVALAGPVAAQWGAGGRGLGVYGVGPRLGENIQIALQSQVLLSLSGEQITDLESLWAGVQRDVAPLEQEIDALRSRIRTADVPFVEGQARLDELLARFETVAEPYRAGVAKALTPQQHATLQRMLYESRPYSGLGYGRAGVGFGYGIGSGRGAGWNAGRAAGWGAGRGAGRRAARGARIRW